MSKKLNRNSEMSGLYEIEARARELQGEEAVRLFRASARALGRAFRH